MTHGPWAACLLARLHCTALQVSLPQLSLLETALGRMARVEVSVMQRFGRSGGNVFEVRALCLPWPLW